MPANGPQPVRPWPAPWAEPWARRWAAQEGSFGGGPLGGELILLPGSWTSPGWTLASAPCSAGRRAATPVRQPAPTATTARCGACGHRRCPLESSSHRTCVPGQAHPPARLQVGVDEFLRGSRVEQAPRPQHAVVIGDTLHVGEDVAGKDHRAAAGRGRHESARTSARPAGSRTDDGTRRRDRPGTAPRTSPATSAAPSTSGERGGPGRPVMGLAEQQTAPWRGRSP